MPAGDPQAAQVTPLTCTPFGVYMLLVELAAPARVRLDTDALFAWWAPRGGKGAGRGYRTRLESSHVFDLVQAASES